MEITLKCKEINPNISPEFAVGLGWIANEWEAWGLGPFVITSLKDGIHSAHSKHKWNKPADEPGEAADITRGQRDITLEGSRRRLGAQFQAAQLLGGVSQFPFQIGNLALGGASAVAQLQAASPFNALLGGLGGAGGGVLSALIAKK